MQVNGGAGLDAYYKTCETARSRCSSKTSLLGSAVHEELTFFSFASYSLITVYW